jgi:hypothetical protein
VFKQEDQAIILEDDTLPDPSFFKFCEELLFRYKSNESVFHICGMNMFPQLFTGENSYCFTSIANMWGWATWSRAWKHYDLQMKDWATENQKELLNKWCLGNSLRKGMAKMFDIHCNNNDPWTWDYQWFYACWRNGRTSSKKHCVEYWDWSISHAYCKRHLDSFISKLSTIPEFPFDSSSRDRKRFIY